MHEDFRRRQRVAEEDRHGDCLAVGVLWAIMFVVDIGLHEVGALVLELRVLVEVVGFVGCGEPAGQVGEAGLGFWYGVGVESETEALVAGAVEDWDAG
ncbi:MAG: hypothetical protein F4047_14420 [Caldilineaceae bacterium SB0670_bin_27]|uniref:Uncharacterized protein n=1 Tax=Caldilineaceae bacterium SB0664_bin_27 TaxID=2605260 RepID=A0A6B0YQ49_9CHLR|nr:hypothetical protein [Caldilineaceae bacterium SB0664_bin_27]MYJ79303.1 hypothetical protein [Caldilineaceae bacterium SB0670_bin_27]